MPTTSKSKERTRGRTVELAYGDSVLVRAWGFDEVEEHTEVIYRLIADVMANLGVFDAPEEGQDGDAVDPAANLDHDVIVEVIRRNWRRYRALIVSTLDGGEDDLQKIAGLLDIWNVTEAMIQVNGIMAVAGKAMAGMNNSAFKEIGMANLRQGTKPAPKAKAKTSG